MGYDHLDPLLGPWAAAHQLMIHQEATSRRRRYFYISQEVSTFQIVVEPETYGMCRIDGHLIEGPDDAEVHYIIEVPLEKFVWALHEMRSLVLRWLKEHGQG